MLIGRLTMPVVMAAVSAALIWRFGPAMSVLDRLGARLREEVAAAAEALRRSFAAEQAQEKKAVLKGERVRLMSDLHDGIAGQLVSILALCELRETDTAGVAEAIRGALTDLRLVVASLEDAGDDLGVMLALFRERIEPQLAAYGMEPSWRLARDSIPCSVTPLKPTEPRKMLWSVSAPPMMVAIDPCVLNRLKVPPLVAMNTRSEAAL
ncbi:MAG: hypothetical protein HQL38_12505 [Alphaproteobacteria bacterium]|nr:hypothetical protein [Alphaproteobacteria bacterium]MBF0393492.1 hypothetical protein [Alphaproteobacteria bacterium]